MPLLRLLLIFRCEGRPKTGPLHPKSVLCVRHSLRRVFAFSNANSIPLYYGSDTGVILFCQQENSYFTTFLTSEAMWVSLAYAPDCSLSTSGSEHSPDPSKPLHSPGPGKPLHSLCFQRRLNSSSDLFFSLTVLMQTCFFLCCVFPNGSSD